MAATKIFKSVLGSYENGDYKEISHKSLVALTEFCEVSTDYILCPPENQNHPNTELTELHLSDSMLELLKILHSFCSNLWLVHFYIPLFIIAIQSFQKSKFSFSTYSIHAEMIAIAIIGINIPHKLETSSESKNSSIDKKAI